MSDALQLLTFRNLLEDLGYDYNARITGGTRHNQVDNTILGNTLFQFVNFFIAFNNKESFLYYRYLHAQQKMPTSHFKTIISEFADFMCMEEKTRIGEIGWEVKYHIHPNQFHLKDRSNIMHHAAKNMRKYIKEGYGGISPCEGDILTAYPYGPNIGMSLGMDSWIQGKKDRANFAKLFGLGDTKNNGWCYGRYDSDLKLRPI